MEDVLITPRRHVTRWEQVTDTERLATFALVEEIERILRAERELSSVRVSFDSSTGLSSGGRFYLRVSPQVPVLGTGGTLVGAGVTRSTSLVTAAYGAMRSELRRAFDRQDLHSIDLLVSFVMRSGVQEVATGIDDVLNRGVPVRLLTTDYLQITDPAALSFFLDRKAEFPHLQVRAFSDSATSFHPKAYLFKAAEAGAHVAFVGSSNLSRSGIGHGVEWNLRTSDLAELSSAFEELWLDPRTVEVDELWLHRYRHAWEARRADDARDSQSMTAAIETEDPAEFEPPKPWDLQRPVLAALEATRIEGKRAGLVVLATGLGKTWVAAFDSTRPSFGRVLFIAHRAEILRQSRDVFRRIRPDASLGLFLGGEENATADVVFASIQLLSKRIDAFAADDFDYVIVDEFHHAAAPTYRRVIGHFEPKFLLGITATPDRSDNADLLALCADNLVYEKNLVAGVAEGALSPFAYRAVKDRADYENIPWRGGRFAEAELTAALATQQRSEQVFDEWSREVKTESRTVGFCASIAHADFMASFFRERGVNALAVHSGPSSADREPALQRFRQGQVPVLFSVDLFNEGVDVPEIECVLMLRPTESEIVFLQQLGRGLRQVDGKRLTILDMVGNHRSFLEKTRMLARLLGRELTRRESVEFFSSNEGIAGAEAGLPEGCSIVVETEAVDLLRQLLGRATNEDRLVELIRDWTSSHGRRPTALEMSSVTRRKLSVPKKGGWFALLDSIDVLDADERQARSLAAGLFRYVENGAYTKSYKLLTMQALANAGSLLDGARIDDLADTCRWAIQRDHVLRRDLDDVQDEFGQPSQLTPVEWRRYWRKNPIAAIKKSGSDHFAIGDEVMRLGFDVPSEIEPAVRSMLAEILEYRLWRYAAEKKAVEAGERRKPVVNGVELDATFVVDSTDGVATSVVIESAGGASGSKAATNTDYVAGFDAVLLGLREMGATISDVYLDTRSTTHLTLTDRRLAPPEGMEYPFALGGVDLVELRKRLLRVMRQVGRAPSTKSSGGNNRKRTRIVFTCVERLSATALANALSADVVVSGSDLSNIQH